MVQTHGSVQLSLGAASIGFQVLTTTYSGCGQITKGSNPDVTKRSFSHDGGKQQKGMDMPSERIKRKLHRFFLSVVEPINNHVKNFVACPGAQVYWWLR